jgi:type III pantothenate kinase
VHGAVGEGDLLLLAVGNPNLHHAVADAAGALTRTGALRLDGPAAAIVARLPLEGVATVAATSVRPDRLEAVEAALAARGLALRLADRDFPIPLANRYERPEEVGQDRLLAVLAALGRFPGDGVAVLDFGTALTLGIGSPADEFLGGLIALGLSSSARAVHELAPRLPRLDLVPPEGFVGRRTARGLNDGLVWACAGAAERMLEGARAAVTFPLRAIATGGDAALVAPFVRGLDAVDPHLVLRGLWSAARGRRQGP